MIESGDLKAGNVTAAKGKDKIASQGTGSPNLVPKAVENNAVFDQAVARIMGSRLGIYDGQDWAGSTPEARHLIGGQVLHEAVRLRETGRLEQGLALATEIGQNQALEAGEAVGQLRNGIDAFGPADMSGKDSTSTGLIHEAPPSALSGPSTGNAQHAYHGTLPADEPQLAPPWEDLEHGDQIGFADWAAIDPDDQED